MGIDQGMKLIVRNTFLEFSEDEPRWQPLGPEVPVNTRRRSVSDLTDTKLPMKFELQRSEDSFKPADHGLSSSLGERGQALGNVAERQTGNLPALSEEEVCTPCSGCQTPITFRSPSMGPIGFAGHASLLMPVDGAVPWCQAPNNVNLDTMLPVPARAPSPPKVGKVCLQLFDRLSPPSQHVRFGNAPAPALRHMVSAAEPGIVKGSVAGPSTETAAWRRGTALATAVLPLSEFRAALEASREMPENTSSTTVMLRSIPIAYTREMLVELIDACGFKRHYDFIYLPMDFRNRVNLGYAFVNLLSHAEAVRFTSALQGFASWLTSNPRACEVSWAHPIQGLEEHVERYRNSPVMHHSMPDEFKPMLFSNGVRVPFPRPTRPIKAPKKRLTARESQGPQAS